jgi:hypothetical protein
MWRMFIGTCSSAQCSARAFLAISGQGLAVVKLGPVRVQQRGPSQRHRRAAGQRPRTGVESQATLSRHTNLKIRSMNLRSFRATQPRVTDALDQCRRGFWPASRFRATATLRAHPAGGNGISARQHLPAALSAARARSSLVLLVRSLGSALQYQLRHTTG